jgi:hypothetical protein
MVCTYEFVDASIGVPIWRIAWNRHRTGPGAAVNGKGAGTGNGKPQTANRESGIGNRDHTFFPSWESVAEMPSIRAMYARLELCCRTDRGWGSRWEASLGGSLGYFYNPELGARAS